MAAVVVFLRLTSFNQSVVVVVIIAAGLIATLAGPRLDVCGVRRLPPCSASRGLAGKNALTDASQVE